MTPSAHGERIGPYTVVDTLGEGGMGVVYLAEQSEPVQRTVALKILKAGRDSDEILARFEAERQALAVMDHPAIAKVFDAGITEARRPYFVMERVVGSPIDEYCDEHRLTVRQRVRLFAEVCLALQHAHQKGVIHRDLKPSNVLVSEVDGRPQPRIIDFGIAKATESPLFDGARLTRDDEVIGTPAYMSPEQIDGSADVDTRTDIYALGVLLYEVLVGALPYDSAAYRGWAAVAAQLHRDPPAPAKRLEELSDTQHTIAQLRQTTPAGLRRELTGDLDWIVSRATDRDRARRYETANGMALDLQRFLAHEAVRARGANTAYLARKFVRRNRVGVAFGATVMLGLAAFSVVTAVQAERIAEARDEAEARRGQAEGLIDFMLSDLRDKLEPLGRLEILDDVGDRATTYFAALPSDQFSDEELASRSRALHQIGQVRLSQGRTDEAEAPFAQSLRLAQSLSERAPEDSDRLWDLGQSQFWVGSLAFRRGLMDEARRAFEGYRDTSLELVARDPANLTWQLELGYSHTNLGLVYQLQGESAAALSELEASLASKLRVLEVTPTDMRRRYDVAQGHFNLAIALEQAGDLKGGRDHLVEDERIKLALTAEDPGNTRWPARLLATHGRLSRILFALGDTAEAVAMRTAQWASASRLIAHDPENATWRWDGAVARAGLGEFLTMVGRRTEGLEHLDRAVDALEAMMQSDSTRADGPAGLSRALIARAEARLSAGDGAGAGLDVSAVESLLGQVLSQRPDDAPVRRLLADGQRVRGDLLIGSGDEDGARAAWIEGVQLLEGEDAEAEALDWRYLMIRVGLLTRLDRGTEAERDLANLRQYGVPIEPGLPTR